MRSTRYWLTFLMGLSISVATGISYAETGSIQATISMDAEGTLYPVGEAEVLFQGAFKGIMYTKSRTKGLNAGFVTCPVSIQVNIDKAMTEGKGLCEIIGKGGDVIYANYTCKGEVGDCKGTFTLTGGTGSYEGISGSGDIEFRTVINALVVGLASGSTIRVSNAIATLPKLNYRIPD